jgi:hypothetical protein
MLGLTSGLLKDIVGRAETALVLIGIGLASGYDVFFAWIVDR